MQSQLEDLRDRLKRLEATSGVATERLSIIVSSCSGRAFEPVSLVVSTALALGLEVQLFFTSWSVCLFGGDKKRDFRLKLRSWLLDDEPPAGFHGLLADWRKQGVKLFACGDSCSLRGVSRRDLDAYGLLEVGGLTTFLASAVEGRATLVM